MAHLPVPADVERVATCCVDASIHVHRALGPGFKEIIYTRAYQLELTSRGINFEAEKAIIVRYKSWTIPGQRIDLVVEGVVLIEVKSVPKIRKLHHHQLMSYLRTMDLRLGFIMNFNSVLMKDGRKRIVL